MAEQNRKTSEQKFQRQRAKDTVDLYIEAIYVSERNSEIARESRSTIGMLVDFRGEIPKGSGFSAFCKLGAKIDCMARNVLGQDHHNAVDWMKALDDSHRLALVYDRALRGRERVLAIDPFHPEKPATKLWTDHECAFDLECSRDVFRRRVSDGYIALESLMGLRCREAA